MKARDLIFATAATVLLGGCAASGSICLSCDSSDESSEPEVVQPAPVIAVTDPQVEQPRQQAFEIMEEVARPGSLSPSRAFAPYAHHKQLRDYVEQMALMLVDNMQLDADKLSIAVTSFVDYDETLERTNQLGNQLAESFMHQMQKFGYATVDFKTTNQIRIGRSGDFVFSRDIENLARQQVASHVLSGTLIYRRQGVEVNARVVDIRSKKVVASSQKLLPYFVIPELASSMGY